MPLHCLLHVYHKSTLQKSTPVHRGRVFFLTNTPNSPRVANRSLQPYLPTDKITYRLKQTHHHSHIGTCIISDHFFTTLPTGYGHVLGSFRERRKHLQVGDSKALGSRGPETPTTTISCMSKQLTKEARRGN